ncbi:hypothetical protein P152DRAFT_460054 [Eremomyces bilateralis CBS 781.70]|uniref:F-box domain-containing protein n=1 Tax=Eremomyces bilateralis CBS 781.70 TaxID=1392243 RepID=A0A6G1FY86_9PEZI|nr:uncharacterized protein P152DRAFT_460054 [Eremomyces bilateralis CBS 781.70]KAF1810763.1 hypothetical protein P152DRAFT_460054 [Eremomyces bilateralis CBS 781.70]
MTGQVFSQPSPSSASVPRAIRTTGLIARAMLQSEWAKAEADSKGDSPQDIYSRPTPNVKDAGLRFENLPFLPQEIREEILTCCLLSLRPIKVCNVDRRQFNEDRGWRRLIGYEWEMIPKSIEDLSLNLLHCGNRHLAADAARIFYGKNTFEFGGDHGWSIILAWLDLIGETNCNHLRHLRIGIHADPMTRSEDSEHYPNNKANFQCNRLFQIAPTYLKRSEMPPEYEFDKFAPIMERVFEKLGSRGPGPALDIMFRPDRQFSLVKILRLYYGWEQTEGWWRYQPYAVKLVQRINNACEKHTSGTSQRKVEMLWDWCSGGIDAAKDITVINRQGWEWVYGHSPRRLGWCEFVILRSKMPKEVNPDGADA